MPTFQTPTDEDVTYSTPLEGGPANALFRHVTPSLRGRNVWKKTDGTFTEVQPDNEDIDTVYYGGHILTITDAEAAALTAAGYGAYIS